VLQRVIRCDAAWYRHWIERALSIASQLTGNFPGRLDSLKRLADYSPCIVDELLQLPVTLIHGEFYASNVLIQQRPVVRVCPIDWERAALAPTQMDLAALVAGNWSEVQKLELADEYFEALPAPHCNVMPRGVFLRGLALCRLQMAVQWLGWSADWQPPGEHRQDWLDEALNMARVVGYDL
jgi:aminoglycoside phosphotransferase (APT) family kinase protein